MPGWIGKLGYFCWCLSWWLWSLVEIELVNCARSSVRVEARAKEELSSGGVRGSRGPEGGMVWERGDRGLKLNWGEAQVGRPFISAHSAP